MKAKKSEEIKARVEETLKTDLNRIAEVEQIDLSDVIRKALREFVQKRTQVFGNLAA